MVSTAVTPKSQPTDVVTLLYHKNKHPFAQDLAGLLEEKSITVQWSQLKDGHKLNEQHDVISTIDLGDPFFYNISADDYNDFMTYLSGLKSGMLWITRPSQIHCHNPHYGLVIGLGRTIRKELGLAFSTIETASLDVAAAQAVCKIFHRFQERSACLDFNFEPEFAIHEATVHIPRYQWILPKTELRIQPRKDDPKQLELQKYGLLDTLHWTQRSFGEPRDSEGEVEIVCVGLNFKVSKFSKG